MTETDLEFSRRVPVRELPVGGREFHFEATAKERKAVARRLGIAGLESLEAHFAVTPQGGGALARGTFKATAVQQCVVTLEPVTSRVEGEIIQRFAPEGAEESEAVEIEFDALEEDPPEPLIHGAAELGELVVEHLSLGLDPYPRRPEAQPDLPHEGEGGRNTPFAKLRSLKFSATET